MSVPAFNLTTLEARVRSRADMVGSAFVTTTEIRDFMEAAWQDLYAQASVQYEDLLVTRADLTAAINTGSLSLPADVKRLRGLRIKDFEFLRSLSLHEIRTLDTTGRKGRPHYYWLSGGTTAMTADILPYCDAPYTITCYYQPALGLADAVAIGSIPQLACWDEYVVLSAVIKCKDKEESSVSTLIGERSALFASMQASWTPTDTSEAGRVVQLNSGRNFMRAYDYQGPDDDY